MCYNHNDLKYDVSYALYCHVHPGCVHLSFVSCDLNNLVHSDYFLSPICHMPYIVMSFHYVFFYQTCPVFYYVLFIRIATTIRCVIKDYSNRKTQRINGHILDGHDNIKHMIHRMCLLIWRHISELIVLKKNYYNLGHIW
jgi:hypothetical protein